MTQTDPLLVVLLAASGYVQADLDSVTTAWTRYGADGSVMNGMNGSGLTGHWRLREGRV